VPEAGVPLGSVCATLAGGGLGEDPLAPVGAKFVELAVEGLVGGTNSCVADELHVVISFWLVARSRAWRSPAPRTDCGTLIAGLMWDSLTTEFTATARAMKVAVRSPVYRSYMGRL